MRMLQSVEPRPIAALQGASGATIQALLADFAGQMKSQKLKVAGLVEVATRCDEGGCGALAVRDLSTGELIPISQDLGPGSTACNLDPGGLAAACAAVERAVAAGADLIVLSKFGKLEAARSGLNDAFRAAFAAGLPIATAVSPAVAQEWLAFVGDYSEFVNADRDALDAWWSRYRRGMLRNAAE
jgi:hypothetical protein